MNMKPEQQMDCSKRGEIMATAVFDNAMQYLTGKRENFLALFEILDESHAKASQKFTELITSSNHSIYVELYTEEYMADINKCRDKRPGTRTIAEVAREGGRVILSDSLIVAMQPNEPPVAVQQKYYSPKSQT